MDERESSSGQPDISVDESRLQSTAMAGSEDNLTRLADHSDSQGDLLPDSYSLQEKPGGLPEAALSTREQQLAFLVTIGDLLGSSLSYEKTLRHLAELLVPRFADWCAIDIANGQDTLERLTVAHANPEKLRLASELYERYPRPQGSQSAAAVFRSGQAQWAQSIPDEWLVEAATDERHLATLRELGLRSYVSVPLSARGVVLGVLTLVTAESGRAYEQEDLIFAQAIASRAAVTIDNTRLFEAAENSLDRLQFTLDAADLGTWEWNVDTGEVTWTEGLMRIHRRKPGEFDGTVDSALSDLHPQDREYVMGAITAALETDAPYHVEYRIITAEKEVRWVEARGRVIRDASGRPRTLQGICMDVTRRKQHHESRAFLASIVESSDDAIVSKSLDGIIQSWNAAAERLFGYAAEQAVGRHIYLIIPADRIDEENQILARLRRGERIEHFDTVRQRSDGQLIHVSLTISPIRDGAGRILGASKIARDITKRMQIEQALRDSEQHLQALTESLERRVEARTAELQRQAVRLRRFAGELASAEQRERKRLAAILHDGLQQLLVAAKIRLAQASSRIQDSRTRSAIEGATELLGQAVASSRNLTRELRPPVLYEGGLIPALRWLASELPRLHGLDIILDAKDVEPPLSDEAKALLFESVRELLFNVAKHSGAKEATVRVLQEERQLQLSVEDQGRGFDVEAAVHEEDPQQLSAGMGLFSIRERLTALGGSMELESAPDKGACIQLTIPLTPLAKGREAAVQEALGPVVAIGPQAIGVAATDSRARVLVVDDHAIVREGIANVLSSDERLVVVGEAADGMEAIEAVEQHRPNVVLIDVNMPRMNGVEATREIHRRWPEVRVVALSVQDDAATAKTMIRAGAAAFISKSDDAAQMIGAVLAAAASN